MTDHLTPADFAAVPWGGRAIPPGRGVERDAVRVPANASDPTPWTVLMSDTLVGYYTDSMMAIEGWTLPAPAVPWDDLPGTLQAAWDTGEVRDGENEQFVSMSDDGALRRGWVGSPPMPANPKRRFRPRPRPSWQDAEVVEASTENNPERRLFIRCVRDGIYTDTGSQFHRAHHLIDPVPMTVQKKAE